jgi:hypothetical protein
MSRCMPGGAEANRLFLVVVTRSPPKLAVQDLPAARPIFGGFFAIVRAALASLRIGLVSKARLGRLSPATKIPFPAAAWESMQQMIKPNRPK